MAYSIKEMDICASTQNVLVRKHIPVHYPNLYVTRELRRRSPNTQRLFLNHIAVLLEFLEAEGIDIVLRLSQRPQAKYLEDSELSRFVQHANWRKEVLRRKFGGVDIIPNEHEYIGQAQAIQRCEAARDYLVFLYEELGDVRGSEAAATWLTRRMNRKIHAARNAWRRSTLKEIKGLSDEQRALLYESFHPAHPNNPFKSGAIRLRNHVMILLGLELGLRRSEMLLVQLGSINYASGTIEIVRPEKDVDSRKPAPRLKTNERRLPASPHLLSAIAAYQREYRKSQASKKHPFLLVAHGRNEGKALSIAGAGDVFLAVRKAFAKELDGITAHTLRHDSVYTLLAGMAADLKALTVEDRATQVQKTLTYAFGWNSQSEMPSLYGARFWQEEASGFFARRAARFSPRASQIDAFAGTYS